MYLGDQDNVGGNSFWNPDLLGHWASVDIELASASCSCNAAWFLVSMPAHDWNGNPQKCGYNDYYCDANDVGGCWCPEMDIMEANKYAFQTTPHRCDQVNPSNKHYNHCDGGGCALNAWNVDSNAFGPGKKIDTNKKFRMRTDFVESGGKLSEIKTTLSQDGGNSYTFHQYSSQCQGGYLEAMGEALKQGMTFTGVIWGSDWNTMKWLDGNTGCGGGCDSGSVYVTYSQMQYGSLSNDGVPTHFEPML